jgi:hypothetical protein
MHFALATLALSAALFAAMLLLIETGRRLGARRLAADVDGARAGFGAVESAVFALLGLLLAFTFSGAASRFDGRRQLIIQEVNAIGTAWLRIDLLPPDVQPGIRDGFRRYLDARLEAYRRLPDVDAAKAELAKAARAQDAIWSQAVAICLTERGERARMLLLPALNEMFDIAQARTLAADMHPPSVIFVMLILLALGCSLLVGYAMAGGGPRGWAHMVGFAAAITAAAYVTLELEYPRLGLIQVSGFDQALVNLRAAMH